jgi:predicted transcriptional regulator
MKTKARSDSKLHKLTAEQRAKVDVWLFTEGLTYKKVAELCGKEFGLQISQAGVCRYFKEQEGRRMDLGTRTGAAAWRLGMATDTGYRELIARTEKLALSAAKSGAKNGAFNRLVELTRLQIAARREANMAQRVALAQEKMEFDAATACLLHQKQIQAIVADEEMDEADRIRAIREELFGKDLPK